MTSQDAFDGVFEAPGRSSCPNKILNSLTSLMTEMDMDIRSTISDEEYNYVRQYDTSFHILCTHSLYTLLLLLPLRLAMPDNRSTVCVCMHQMQAFFHQLLNPTQNLLGFTAEGFSNQTVQQAMGTVDAADAKHSSQDEMFTNLRTRDCYTGLHRFATYPPVLPFVNDDECIAGFVKSWMTSIWHWFG